MKGNRDKQTGESLPDFELIKMEYGLYQFRYDFEEIAATDEHVASFHYHCVNVKSTDRDTLISAIIRERYSQDKVESLLNNVERGKDILEFLKLQNYRAYAKAAADKNNTLLQQIKVAQVYKVSLPFPTTLSGGIYEDLANRMLKVKVPFAVNANLTTATAYPGWISDDDMAVLEADDDVTIEQLDLYDA